MFGRKGLSASSATSQTLADVNRNQGHVSTIEHAQAAGEFFFELLYQKMASGSEAVGIENFLGLLSSAGGVACIATALCEYETVKMGPHDPNLLLSQEIDGLAYFVGDLPTRYLYEHQHSLLNIALPWAMKHGAELTHDFLHEPVRHVTQSVGTRDFGIPRLPAEYTPDMLPIDLALAAWPQAEHSFESVGLAIDWRPAAMGFAIGKAIDKAAHSLDPMILAKIVVECAVPMAAVDPSRFLDRLNAIRADA
jgi:hypothetical protein